jgi:hypothetical protein
MTDTFFAPDVETAKHDIVNELYDRLDEVRRGLKVQVSQDDEFDIGISCRLANEEMWLQKLLDKIERS